MCDLTALCQIIEFRSRIKRVRDY